MPVQVTRSATILKPDQSRVLARAFNPGNTHRVASIAARIMSLPEDAVGAVLNEVLAEFSTRHRRLRSLFLERFEEVCGSLLPAGGLSEQRRLLIGSYFLSEYSLEAAALFNPSIVPHPDQADLPPGALRFILSLRAVGEGHISSIVFQAGVIQPDCHIDISSPTGFVTEPCPAPGVLFDKVLFERKLAASGLTCDIASRVMGKFGASFSMEELRSALQSEHFHLPDGLTRTELSVAQRIWVLARSNYEVEFKPDQPLAERVLFPATPAQRNGIEDARFVCFRDEDGSSMYYATYTAYDGKHVAPGLVGTADFLHFRFVSLHGPAAENKGMALFPRRIGGRYAMLSRQDSENLYLTCSDHLHFWKERSMLLKPAFSWEMVQIGNCGSPLETDAGWLVLSHGVGPMRKYCIGAFLLDRDDPSKVIGRLRRPLLTPILTEREGYVPNVVYTCGALLHNGILVIPYGLADHATGFATVPLADVLGEMQADGRQ